MKNDPDKLWEVNIFWCIKNISDIETQKLSWAGNHPEIVGSFTEALAMLYDDFDFEDFIEYYKMNYANDELIPLLIEFNNLIEDYSPKGYKLESLAGGFQQILNDEEWITITKKAEYIINVR